MAFDGIAVRALAEELDAGLRGARVEKIYQPGADEIVIHARSAGGKMKVYASSNNSHAGIFFTDGDYENPMIPPRFCTLLRKHIAGGRISGVSQKGIERIIEVGIDCRDELGIDTVRNLIVEIMGKYSNITLTDRSGRIIDSMKRIGPDIDRARQVLPGMQFEYPPVQNKIPYTNVTFSDIDACVCAAEASGRQLSDIILDDIGGLSPAAAREIASFRNAADIFERIEKIRASEAGSGQFSPRVYENDDGMPKDFHVIDISEYHDLYNIIPFDTISAAAEYYFTKRETSNRIKQRANAVTSAINKALKKQRLKKQRLSEDIMTAEEGDKYRLYGELVTANIHSLKTGQKEASLINYYDGSEIVIPLDERYAPAKNAQIYFKKYAKSKTALKEKVKQLTETDSAIEYLLSAAAFAEDAATVEDIDRIREELTSTGFMRGGGSSRQNVRKEKYKPKPYSYITSDGFEVLAGRNNRENDILTFKSAGRNDIWLHVKDIPGSHVILFLKGRDPTDKAIYEAAAIAAFHSKGRSSENVPVDYTRVRFVKKPSGAKPGMVIFTDNRTVYVDPKRPDGLK